MTTNLDLVAAIAANTSAHLVNREDKINRTIDVMCANAEKQITRRMNSVPSKFDSSRGYGQGRKMGD